MAYTKRNGKKKLTIEVSKNSFVHRLVMDVMHRIVTGATYDLKYQMRKEEPAEAKKEDAAPKSVSLKKEKVAKVSNSETVSIPRTAPKKPEVTVTEVSEPEVDDELPGIDAIGEIEVA